MITHIITEYLIYSPKKHMNCCESLNSLSHQSEKLSMHSQIEIVKVIQIKEKTGVWIIQSSIMHHVSGIMK